MKQKICSWCKTQFKVYGNNSWYVTGIICDKCNKTKEIPKRIKEITND